MTRRVSWFSSGAASAVATKLGSPDVIVNCDTGSEDKDNARFLDDCEKWFGQDIDTIKNEDYVDTWDLWEKKQYLSDIYGAPCTRELKRIPRLRFQNPDDIHIMGYTSDERDVTRALTLQEHYPNTSFEFPLIKQSITKSACLAILNNAGITPPRVYAMGFEHANCMPCCKATSISYWALVRKEFPDEFERMAELSSKLRVRLTRLEGERIYLDEMPMDIPCSDPISPACDVLCELAEGEIELHTRRKEQFS